MEFWGVLWGEFWSLNLEIWELLWKFGNFYGNLGIFMEILEILMNKLQLTGWIMWVFRDLDSIFQIFWGNFNMNK